MYKLDQSKAPFLEAVMNYVNDHYTSFDVPGHHLGNVKNDLKDFLGDVVYKSDINAPYGLDNLAHPTGVIKEAEDLFADFAGADHAFFLINGTSSGIITMIMTVCKANDRIILPRNVHKSIINALVLSGAKPVYVMPDVDSELEIANQPSIEDYVKAMKQYPSAKAIFIINPTYFGAVTDLKRLVEEAHSRGMAVLVDEAHGAHYYFNNNGPVSAMAAGADFSSVSFHKTGGSLTQTSVLLLKSKYFTKEEVKKTLNIINTTSPSYLLLASLDAARKFAALNGQKEMDRVKLLADYARKEIGKIPGFVPCNKDLFIKKGCFDYDETKLAIELDHLDINGFDLFKILNQQYQIQIELGETHLFLCVLSIGTKEEHFNVLINALKDLSYKHYRPENEPLNHLFSVDFPFQLVRPRSAYHAPLKFVSLDDATNQVSKEQIMIYPPGIPLIIPGEVFTKDLIQRIKHYKNMDGVTILSDYELNKIPVIDLDKWTHLKSHLKKNYEDFVNKNMLNPRSDSYNLPFEGEKHSGTIILLPFRKDTWREKAKPAQEAFKKLVFAIANYEPVFVGISPRIYEDVIADYIGFNNIFPFKVKYNDCWSRDICPIFLRKNGNLRIVDFRFNAWGGEVDGLYSNYRDDDAISKVLAKKFALDSYRRDKFVLEGSSFSADGQGTCVVTEECLLSKGRNPNRSKLEIEEELKTYLNLTKVIWIKHGLINDKTNESVENMCAFVKPGKVLLAWTDDKESLQYKHCFDAYEKLSNSYDAEGRKLEVIKVPIPSNQTLYKYEFKGVVASKKYTNPRKYGDSLPASYINFYQSDRFVLVPQFGTKEDNFVVNLMKKCFENKIVIPFESREILIGGGNIHSITMQIPYSEMFEKSIIENSEFKKS